MRCAKRPFYAGRYYDYLTDLLVGLTLRGVAFDFRVKAREAHKPLWNQAFFAGSLPASLSQGFMFGHYITGCWVQRG